MSQESLTSKKMTAELPLRRDVPLHDQCGADLMPIYTALKESLSGGNPGEPNACTGAEERGISGATGAGQLPDGNPESTGDSADRRSPGGTERTPSPDESNRHFDRGCFVIMELMQAYERRVRSDCTPEQIEKRPWECAEYLKAAEYLRNVWPPHEPPQPAEATECRYCDEVMKERDDYHEWADTLAYDIERLVGVEIGEHSNLNSPWGNAHDAAEYELDKRARKPHEPRETPKGPRVAEWPELPSKTNPDILVDERCMDLAKHFLAGGAAILGEPQDCVANRSSLARDIQQAVEDWFLEASLTKEKAL